MNKIVHVKTIEIITLEGGRWSHRGMQSLWTFFVSCPYFSSGSSKHCILLGPYKQFIARAVKQWEIANSAWTATKWCADGKGPWRSCPVVAVALALSFCNVPDQSNQSIGHFKGRRGRNGWEQESRPICAVLSTETKVNVHTTIVSSKEVAKLLAIQWPYESYSLIQLGTMQNFPSWSVRRRRTWVVLRLWQSSFTQHCLVAYNKLWSFCGQNEPLCVWLAFRTCSLCCWMSPWVKARWHS